MYTTILFHIVPKIFVIKYFSTQRQYCQTVISDKKIFLHFAPVFLLCTNQNCLVQNIRIPQQHGFYKSRSLESNLFCYCEFRYDNMDNRFQTDVIYTNFSKDFDKIINNILLRRAEVGVGGVLLHRIETYKE